MAQMTPSEAFVETMVANKVTDMFGIMGIGLGGFQEANQLPMFQEHTK